jgi:general secretion pathway protein G
MGLSSKFMRKLPRITLTSKNSGFTLMEVMVVIVILGILATMVMGAYLASQKKGRDIRRKSDLGQLTKALDMYFNDRGRYPASDNGVIQGCGDPAIPSFPEDCAWGTEMSITVSGNKTTYEVQLPKDPQGGKNYYYSTDANGTYYQLYALLENTEDPGLTKDNGKIQYYTGTSCNTSADGCTFGIASTNKLPADGHDLATP